MTRLSEIVPPAFYPVYHAVRDGGAEEVWLSGGRGSGKSSYAAVELVLSLIERPETHAIVFRKVAATLRESVYEQILWAIARLGLQDYFIAKLSPLEIVRRDTGQRILFRGADDPGKVKSLKVAEGGFGFLWFEELAELEGIEALQSIRASVCRGEGVRCLTFCTYNPPCTMAHWINAEAIRPKPGRFVHHSDYTQMPREWLGDGFLREAEAVKASNERLYRSMYLGEITGTGGQVFDNVRLRPLTRAEIDCPRSVFCGLDFGFAVDPDAFVRVGFDRRRRRLWLIDEFVKTRAPASALAEAIRPLAGGGLIRCDSADPRLIQELRSMGLQTVAVRKGAGSVGHGMRFLQALEEIAIDPARTPEAAREFSVYSYRPDGRGGFCAEYPDRENHTIDAVRYALEDETGGRAAVAFPRSRLL